MSKIAVIYWSGTGNTQIMAKAIESGIKEGGGDVELFEVSAAPNDLSGYEKIAFGCPSMGDEVLEEGDFEPYFTAVEGAISGKKVALFGSYGWGDGQWMREWAERARKDGAILMDDGKMANYEPDEGECVQYGKDFAAF